MAEGNTTGGRAQADSIVLVSPHAEDHASLRRILYGSHWKVREAFTLREGLDLLSRNPRSNSVTICEHSLPDGDWKLLLAELAKMPAPPSLIVSSRLADERLWAEVLNFGAFDLLLSEPFVDEEVLRVTESARRAARETMEQRTTPRMRPRVARASQGGLRQENYHQEKRAAAGASRQGTV